MIGRASRASALPLLFLLLAPATAATTSRTAAPRPPGVELAVRRPAPGMVAVRVRLDGTNVWMLVDTGATRSRVDARLAARLGMRPQARYPLLGLDGRERLAPCTPATIAFPSATAGGVGGAGAIAEGVPEAIETRIDCLAWSAEMPVPLGLDGVLGADAVTQADVLLDTEAGRVRVAPAGSLGNWVDGARISARRVVGRPAIAAHLGERGIGASGFVVLDSGSDSTILFGELARDLDATGDSRTRRPRIPLSTASGTSMVATTRALSLQVGTLKLPPHRAVLLPEVEREELGLLPPATFGPTLLALGDGVVVAGARLRRAPLAEAFEVAALGTLAVGIAP